VCIGLCIGVCIGVYVLVCIGVCVCVSVSVRIVLGVHRPSIQKQSRHTDGSVEQSTTDTLPIGSALVVVIVLSQCCNVALFDLL
jgi:hypothetical protein